MDNRIQKSLFDKSIKSIEYNPKIVINEGSKNIKTTIIENLNKSDRFDIAVSYVVWSGFSLLKSHLEKFDSNSRFILTTEGLVTDPNSLYALLDLDIQVKVYDPYSNSRGFHLKSYLFETNNERTLLVGSNNISVRALGNVHEMAMEVNANKDGFIIQKYQDTFDNIWNDNASHILTKEFIDNYLEAFSMKREMEDTYYKYELEENKIRPNYMQELALIELEVARQESDRGLVIAATGTGKTYLSAFDVQNSKADKVLFLVHNRLILKDAIATFKRVFKSKKILELNSSNLDQFKNHDFIFTTDKTAFTHLLNKVSKDYFDYIIYDEAHKIGEDTNYNSIIKYFTPKFSLGITATPERTDNPRHLFETFNYNIPYEIRLLDAMDNELVCPFTYYGFNLDEKLLEEDEKFNYEELASYLKNIIKDKGYYGQKLKGLVFASSIAEANTLKDELNKINIITESAVSGSSNNEEIGEYIESLKSNDEGTIQLITTVNKFNEGIDIPEVNVIIMLRNTTSSIIYLQQLGRGLRRTNDPDKFVTVIDIIGNSKNNYSIAEVLTGNETKDKRLLLKSVNTVFNEVSPFINVEIEKQAMEKIIKSITNDFKVETELKRKYNNELERFKEIPTLLELYKNPNFNELDLLQLLFKNFHTPFSKHYKNKYEIQEDNQFVKSFFTLISQFVLRGYNSNELKDYVKLLKGETISNKALIAVLVPKEVSYGRTTAINSSYYNIKYNNPSPFIFSDDSITIDNNIFKKLKEDNAFCLFEEHIDLFKYLIDNNDYRMKPFDLIDKGEFLFNNNAKDCYMNVVGERIDHELKKVYCTVTISTGETTYDNKIIGTNKVLYHTQSSDTLAKAKNKTDKLIEENYEFVICAKFPHLGYANTSYFNLGKVVRATEIETKEYKGKYNSSISLELENDIPIELLMYERL